MILTELRISGYKSFRKTARVFLSPRTTVLIGPNDHGKTNALLALEKMNPGSQFTKQEVNDRVQDESAARISFQLKLSGAEIRTLERAVASAVEKEIELELSDTKPEGTGEGGVDALLVRPVAAQRWWQSCVDKNEVTLVRIVDKPLEIMSDELPSASAKIILPEILKLLPKVSLFRAETLRQLPDTVNVSTIETNEVMQGVFRLASIWESRAQLLSGNTRKNQDDLREASKRLTKQIQKNWTQGKDLEFFWNTCKMISASA